MCNYQSLDLRGTQFFLPFTPHHSAPDLIGATTRLEIPNLGIGRRSWNPLQWILSLPTVFQPRASSFKSFRLFHLYFICISSAFHLHFICISSAFHLLSGWLPYLPWMRNVPNVMSFMIPLELCGAHCFRNDRNTHPRVDFFVRSVQKLWYLRICSLHSPAAKWFVSKPAWQETILNRRSWSFRFKCPVPTMELPFFRQCWLGPTWTYLVVDQSQRPKKFLRRHLPPIRKQHFAFHKLNIDLMGTYGYIMV
jgi:hypothetical protein